MVYGALALLYLHAWHLRDALELNELEKFDTRFAMLRLMTLVEFGVIAAGLACIPALRNWSAMFYILLLAILRSSRVVHRRRRTRHAPGLRQKIQIKSAAAPSNDRNTEGNKGT